MRSNSGFTRPRSADQAPHHRGAIIRGARRSIPSTIVAPATSGVSRFVSQLGNASSARCAIGSANASRTMSVSMNPK